MLSGLIGSASLDVTEHFGTWALGQVVIPSKVDTAAESHPLRKERASMWTPRAIRKARDPFNYCNSTCFSSVIRLGASLYAR